MRPINHKLNGTLYTQNDKLALLWDDAAATLYLRYAFIVRGPEDHIIPAFLLDDWGNEIRKLELYRWVEENADFFPRAELFGYEMDGSETQVFLRAFELISRYPCYVYPDKTTPVPQGRRLHRIWLPDSTVTEPVKVECPAEIKSPLRRAQLSWWRVNPQTLTADPLSHGF